MIASVSGKRLHCNPVIIILIIALALVLICHFQKHSELTHFTNCMGPPSFYHRDWLTEAKLPLPASTIFPVTVIATAGCDSSALSVSSFIPGSSLPGRLHFTGEESQSLTYLFSQHCSLKPPAPPSYIQVSPPPLWSQVSPSIVTPPLSPPCSELARVAPSWQVLGPIWIAPLIHPASHCPPS